MPELDLSQPILSAGADFQAEDWAQADAGLGLDVRASADLRRGIDLELGIGIMAQLSAAFGMFIAADAEVRANASARLRGQIQLPTDLFGEIGAALRLEAVAEAGVSAQLGIGLDVGDFIALAEADPRMAEGPAMPLLRVLLQEVSIGGGVSAKAAVAAMAYANLVIVGRLVPDAAAGLPAGFTLAGEFGAGLKAGAGFKVHANLGLANPRRLVRRSIDVAVDATLRQIAPLLPDDSARAVLSTLRAPAKMALRAAFEVGFSLAPGGDAAADTTQLAARASQVVLEEAQRLVLERLATFGAGLLMARIEAVGISQARWTAARAAREAVATQLEQTPEDAFEPTPENMRYWLDLVSAAFEMALALTSTPTAGAAGAALPQGVMEPLALLWSACQLTFACVHRISDASARASLFGLRGTSTQPSFEGDLLDDAAPPAPVRDYLLTKLGRQPGHALTQDDLVEFLVDDTILEELLHAFPDLQSLFQILAGPSNVGLVAAAQTMLRNVGAFAPGSNGSPDASASLRVLGDGLRSYVDARLTTELLPLMQEALRDAPELMLYIDDVLLPSLRFSVDVILDEILTMNFGAASSRTALREACSSIVMKLLGRSLIVTTDVVGAHAAEMVSAELRSMADHVDDPGGAAEVLSDIVGLEQREAFEIVQETLLIAADVFGPLPDATRARVRALLYDLIDTMPPDADADWLAQLGLDAFVPNQVTLEALAGELGGILIGNLQRFVTGVLVRVAQMIAAEIAELVDATLEEIGRWLNAVAGLVLELAARLLELADEIARLAADVTALGLQALGTLADVLQLLSSSQGRAALLEDMRNLLVETSVGLLELLPGYGSLPVPVKDAVRAGLSAATSTVVRDDVVAVVAEQVAPLLEASAELLEDLAELNPAEPLASQIASLILDRIEEQIEAVFGDEDPELGVSFEVHYLYTPPPIGIPPYVYQAPPVQFDLTFDLGLVTVPLNDVIDVLRAVIEGLDAFDDLVDSLAGNVRDWLDAQLGLAEAEAEETIAMREQETAQRLLAEASPPGIDLAILSPTPGASFDTDVDVVVSLTNVPWSFIGSDRHASADPCQRVFLWVNEDLIDLATVDVTERHAGPVVGPSRLISGGRVVDLTGPAFLGGPVFSQPGLHHRSATGATTVADTGRQVKARPRLGRTTRGSEVRRKVDASPPGLVLRRRIPLLQLREGINTVSAAVVDARGQRVEQTVAFVVEQPPMEPQRKPGRWVLDLLPDDVRGRLGPGLPDLERGAHTVTGRPKAAAKNFWMPLREERAEAQRVAHAALQPKLAAPATAALELREATKAGRLRPRFVLEGPPIKAQAAGEPPDQPGQPA